MHSLVSQATQLSNQIAALQSKKGFLGALFKDSEIQANVEALSRLTAKIADLQNQMDNTLAPVQVLAKRIRPIGDTEQLPDINFSGDDAMMAAYLDKRAEAAKTDVQVTADAWQQKEDLARQALAEGLIDATQFSAKLQEDRKSVV